MVCITTPNTEELLASLMYTGMYTNPHVKPRTILASLRPWRYWDVKRLQLLIILLAETRTCTRTVLYRSHHGRTTAAELYPRSYVDQS